MKGNLKHLRLAAVLALACASLGFSQVGASHQPEISMRPASLQPGQVNYIEGQVSLNGANLQSAELRSTVLQPGGGLSTGQGYAEVLLSPGAFLRIGNNSEIRLVSAGLVNSRVDLIRGSALLEAADVVKGSTLNIGVGNSTALIGEKGLYAFDANNRSVRVFDGRLNVTVGSVGETILKKGDQVFLASDRPLKKQDFKKKAAEEDPLYVWSKVRSHDEAEASINVADLAANSGGRYGSGWYWDPTWSFYAFAPGYGYLGGPFGWNYYSPGFLYGGYWGRGYQGGYPGRYYGASRGYRGGIGYAHAVGGMHSMGGAGFHSGGGHR